jgi:hypothetical protein
VIGGQLKQYVVFTGHINLCPDGSETHLDGSGTFVRGSEGPGSGPEVSGMSRNGPGMSRKVLEASRRFRKVPGSTTHYPTPLALGASHLGCPKSSKGWGGEIWEESYSK